MTEQRGTAVYFPHTLQISDHHWRSLDLGALSRLVSTRHIPPIIFYRQLAVKLNRLHPDAAPVHAAQLNLFATLQSVLRYLMDVLAEQEQPGILLDALRRSGAALRDNTFTQVVTPFVELFPPQDVLNGGVADAAEWLNPKAAQADQRRRLALRELLLLHMAAANPAIDSFRVILDDRELASRSPAYGPLAERMTSSLVAGPLLTSLNMTLGEALLAPVKAAPDSLAGQVGFIREHWQVLLPDDMQEELATAYDILLEEERERGWGGEPGPPPVLEFRGAGRGGAGGGFSELGDGSSVFGGYDYPEYESFSADADWMSHVVLMAKMVYVWLDQLGKQYGYPITRLDQVPDAELDRLASAGFTGLWLIGIWERSPASQRIKQLCGNPEAIASAYSLYDYEIADDLGGWEALGNLRQRAARRGIRLASDMVPNHTGIYSRWVIQHPDWFVQSDYPPFPTYQFNGEDLSHSGEVCIQVEDGYWSKTDAAVVFRYIERNTGRTRYIYHGNDGTSIPWNDTAQLNYLIPEVREAVIQTILHVARNFPIIRFDAAMTLAKKHYQRLWFPLRGLGGGIPSRAEHSMTREEFDAVFPVEFWREVVDRVAVEAPGTLLLAEAFWMMEGYFVRTLGMHRVYNSAFMNMLKTEENAKYRQTIKNVLEFNPEVLKRFVNFMNNPDEKTAVEQFGTQGKYFGACMMMVTMPGLPMFGHGQIEGLHEKYGMEYKRAYWDEQVDQGLMQGHEMWIFPLLRRRWLFSGSENFALYDFYAGDTVDENVFAYSNRCGEQRALVLYHNSYATTSGWIRESSTFAVRNQQGDQELRRTDLAGALGFSAEAETFYAFRDVISGREYLRKGQELCRNGLYAELGQYEFAVFLDFRRITDEEGEWEALCDHLGGRGVHNLEDELRQLQYAGLNQIFGQVLTALKEAVAATTREDALRGRLALMGQAGEFVRLLAETRGDSKGVVADVAAVRRSLRRMLALARLVAPQPGGLQDDAAWGTLVSSLLTVEGRALLCTWLLLRGAADALDRYGLDYTLGRLLKLPGSEGQPVQLLRALLAAEPDLHQSQVDGDSIPVAAVCAIPACRDYLLVHESEETVWFNKERLEQLLQWLALLQLDSRRRGWSSRATSLVGEVERLVQLAAHAGYRLVLFLRLVTPAEHPESVKKRVSRPIGKSKT